MKKKSIYYHNSEINGSMYPALHLVRLFAQCLSEFRNLISDGQGIKAKFYYEQFELIHATIQDTDCTG